MTTYCFCLYFLNQVIFQWYSFTVVKSIPTTAVSNEVFQLSTSCCNIDTYSVEYTLYFRMHVRWSKESRVLIQIPVSYTVGHQADCFLQNIYRRTAVSTRSSFTSCDMLWWPDTVVSYPCKFNKFMCVQIICPSNDSYKMLLCCPIFFEFILNQFQSATIFTNNYLLFSLVASATQAYVVAICLASAA